MYPCRLHIRASSPKTDDLPPKLEKGQSVKGVPNEQEGRDVNRREIELVSGEAPRDPEELEAAASRRPAELSASTRVGPVHLIVAELGRSVDYYEQSLGLELLDRRGGDVSLGVGERELLVLVEEPGAGASYGYTGLYHFALLVPERADLARWLAHAARARIALVGLSDHFVSEAIYLADPDGHGIEIYWDRPRQVWEGHVGARMTTLPLDVDSLFSELADPASAPFEGLPVGTVMGHIHLKVATIAESVSFYRDVLGFALMAELGGQAAFLSAGGYHHHIGVNTWESASAAAPPPRTAALQQATIVLADSGELDRVANRLKEGGHSSGARDDGVSVRDPSGNPLLLTVG
jgi:catechol 2,3-dioxygenase